MKTNFLRLFKVFACLLFVALWSSEVKAQYCTPTFFQGCALSGSIDNFSVTGASATAISDLGTGCSSTGTLPVTCYRDMHTTMSVTFNPGSSYTASTSTAIGIIPADVQIFIDFNDNFSFTDAGETVGGGTFSLIGSTSITILIPSGAAAGVHRMRIVASGDEFYPSVNPCPTYSIFGGGTNTIGEVHDYNVNISGTVTTCPAVTGLTVSAIAATTATLNWTAATGAIGYEWAVTTSATPPASGTLTTLTTANATALTASTAYYAHVRTKCSATSFSSWVSVPFTTLSTTGCAAPAVTLGAGTSSTQIVNWTAVTGAIGYEWSVTTSATPPASGTATTLLTATASGLTASTAYYAHVRTKCSAASFSAWTSIPFTTAASTTTCAAPSLSLGAGTSTTQIVNWAAITGATGYEWVVDMLATAPTGSGTGTTLTTFTATGLTAATTYYAHVRTNCGTSNSTWTTIPFTTGPSTAGCNPVTGLTASAITATTATISWTAVTGSVGYQYVINNVVTAPTGSGTNIAATTYNATALTAGTTYYAHVRDSCGPTSLSVWNTIPFTTLSTTCNAVTSLVASAITSNSATITWVRPTGTIAAQYVIDNNPANPAVSGTTTTLSTRNLTGLSSSTTYYAHVRDTCGATALSAWVTIPITTLASGVGVVDINAENGFGINAYPNPVSGALTVEIQGGLDNEGMIQVMDVTGKLLKVLHATDRTVSIDMSGLSTGLYLVRYTDAAHTQTIKINKQ